MITFITVTPIKTAARVFRGSTSSANAQTNSDKATISLCHHGSRANSGKASSLGAEFFLQICCSATNQILLSKRPLR